MSLVLGLDEAGRGPVLGPLVVCGCAFEAGALEQLAALGVADSKTLKPAVRRRLAEEIRGLAEFVVVRALPPAVVDGARLRGLLNQLETEAMVAVIRETSPDEVYVDALGNRPHRFGRALAAALGAGAPRIVAESRADATYPVVSAASIVAKVERDATIAALTEEHGDVGSGYPGDPRTMAFLRRCRARGAFPACVRRSWRTLDRVMSVTCPEPG